MGTLIKPPAWWSEAKRRPPDPPDMDLYERTARIEATVLTLATKEDLAREIGGLRGELHQEIGGLRAEMHKEISAQTWRFITWVTGLFVTVGGAMVAATYFIARQV